MPATINLAANSTIARNHRDLGKIIRQLSEISGGSRVHYVNDKRHFVITAPKREICEKTARAIEKAMDDLAKQNKTTGNKTTHNKTTHNKTTHNKTTDNKTGKQRLTEIVTIPPTMNPSQLLTLQKSFGCIGRYVGSGCYFTTTTTTTTSTITIQANNSRAIGLARLSLQGKIAEIMKPPTRKKPVVKKPERENMTGKFDAFRQTDEDDVEAKAATTSERQELQATLNQWTSKARLGGRDARRIGSKMHAVRCEIADQKGVDARSISDRIVQAEMRKQEPSAEPAKMVSSVKVYQSSNGPAKVEKPVVKGRAWANAAAKMPTSPKAISKKLAVVPTRFGMTTTGSSWASDDDEDVEDQFASAASAFEDEVDAIASSA